MTPSDAVLLALAATAELCGTELSVEALRVLQADLAAYPETTVLDALARCRRELTGRLTLAAIVERLEAADGRPGPEAAWAGCPRDEGETVVWTNESREAFGVAAPLLAAGDRIGARMAFLEAYRRLVAEARAAHTSVRWTVSLGQDAAGRLGPVEAALATGRLTAGEVEPLRLALGPGALEQAAWGGGPVPLSRALAAGLNGDEAGDVVMREGLATLRTELAVVDHERAAQERARAAEGDVRRAREAERRRLLAAQAAALWGEG